MLCISLDLDLACVFAESLIGRTSWALWDVSTGESAIGASTLEASQVL